MNKQYIVFCFHNIIKEFDTSVILITDNLVQAVDTVQRVEKLGYDLVKAESYAAVAEMVPGKVYTKKEWDNLSTGPKVCTYHYFGGNLRLKWHCIKTHEEYLQKTNSEK
ncbi:MAG: hypothetical protein WCQ32_02000 [bacterium]